MPSNRKLPALADPKRFRTIQDLTKMRPDCGASIEDFLVIDNELLLIVDIAHMSSIMNPYNNPSAVYIRTHGVIVGSYIRDAACPVLWNDPFLLLPLSYHLQGDLAVYENIGELVGNIFCPSGSFLLLPLREDMPTLLDSRMNTALASKNGLKIKLSNGTHRVFYEQFEAPEGSKQELYQNIVVQRQ